MPVRDPAASRAGSKGQNRIRAPGHDQPEPRNLLDVAQGMAAHGLRGGETFLARSGEGDLTRLPALIRDLIEKDVGVLVVVGADAVRVAAATTKTTPIVAIDMETDPVQTGLVASFARPGGNVTGLFLDLPSLATKWIELMREAAPGLERIAIAWQPSTGRNQLDVALEVARALGVEAIVLETATTDDFANSFSHLAGPKQTGIRTSLPYRLGMRRRLNCAALLPYHSSVSRRKKGFDERGPKQEDYFPRAIQIADRILRGESVGQLPIERPTKFELVLILKTAKALGLTLPPTLLTRADEVIE